MVSLEILWIVRAAPPWAWAVVAACVCPLAGRASSAADEDPFIGLSAGIAQARDEGGAYAKDLIDPLTRLSLLYRENGDYALEAATLEQALQVVRANYGLRSLEQAPLLRQRIRSEEARGNFAEAWALEQELLELAHRHPDDVRTTPVLREIGDKRLELRRRYLAGERPPQLYLGCYYAAPRPLDAPRNCESGSREGAARRMLVEAQRHYASALVPLRRERATASAELAQLEDALYRNSYLLGDYRTGRQSLVRRIYDDAANEEPPLTRIDRLVELADWDLRARRFTLAYDLYAEIYAYLDGHGEHARAAEIFMPATPTVVPSFVPNLFAPERADAATGYVDVEFEIAQFGTRRVRVVAAHNASRSAQQRIQRWVVENDFRPQTADGAFDAATRVVARHYVQE